MGALRVRLPARRADPSRSSSRLRSQLCCPGAILRPSPAAKWRRPRPYDIVSRASRFWRIHVPQIWPKRCRAVKPLDDPRQSHTLFVPPEWGFF